MDTKRSSLRILLLAALLAFQTFTPAAAAAQGDTRGPAMTPDLYRAVLEATSQSSPSLHFSSGSYQFKSGGLSAALNSQGLSLTAEQGNALNWSVQIDGFGRGDNPGAVSPSGEENRKGQAILHYSGFSQWLRETGIGLEQGFTIDQSPQGNGPLVLRMRLATSLTGNLSKDARTLRFDTGGGQSLYYSNLRVFDADNRELGAKLVYSPQQILIQVDERNAVYPLTVDPLIYLETKVISVDGAANDDFGYSVALSGDTAIVGAEHKDNLLGGAAYIFRRSGLTWSQQAELTASDGPFHAIFFGNAVAISGNTAIVGAVGNDDYRGEAYIFTEPEGGWTDMTETARLSALDGLGSDHFGFSVAISGDTALVGAYQKTIGPNSYQGKAYVFVKPAGGWATMTESAGLTASDGATNGQFGFSVALSGNTALVGAIGADGDKGKAYVFVKPDGGWMSMTETAGLKNNVGSLNDDFGSSVAVSGQTAIIGADGIDYGGNNRQGGAFVFVEPASGWTTAPFPVALLDASDGGPNDEFGSSVAISGDMAIIGASGHEGGQGKAYVFVKPTSGWATTLAFDAGLTASDTANSDLFGHSVAISGDTAFAGAPHNTVGTHTGQGSAYFFFPYRMDQDLAAGAAVNHGSPLPGETVTLTASMTNLGPSSASTVLVGAPLPDGFTFVSAAPTFGSYDSSTGSWDIGTLALGLTATLSIQATVGTSLAGTHPTFTASLLGWDTNNSNNSASANLHVPLISFSPSAPIFADQLMLTASPMQTITVVNLSNGDCFNSCGDIELGTLTAPPGFLISDDGCSTNTLPAHGGCAFNVQFKPASPIAYSGTISVPSLVPSDTAMLHVSGTGLAGTQLLANRSFEFYSLHFPPAGWTKGGTWVSPDGVDCTVHHSGSCSLEFTGTNALKSLSFAVNHRGGSAGDDFLFTLWSKAQSVPSAAPVDRVRIQVFNGATLIQTYTLKFAKGTHAFTKSSLPFTMAAPYDYLKVIIEYKAASGKAWFDDASLLWAP